MSLLESVKRCYDDALRDPALVPLHPRLADARAKLDEPLRVAVSGQLSAGKSTLVNALVRRRIAATGRSETTEVNAWFRAGSDERAVLRRLDGSELTVRVEPGRELPTPEDLDRDALEPITIFLDEPFLADLTVIDSPGLFSPNKDRSERAVELLRDRTARAASAADALIYLTPEIPGSTRDDRELQAFQSLFGGMGKAPTNALLLLSKIDEKWDKGGADSRDPLAIGEHMIERHGQELWKRVWSARPLAGLLAELARAESGLSAQDHADLVAMARYPKRRRLVQSETGLARADIPEVPLERRRALIGRLGAWGLYRALELSTDEHDGAEALLDGLLESSGLPAVLSLVNEVFRQRSELIRSDSALTVLERLALARETCGISSAAADALRARVETVRLAPHAERLSELRAIRLVCDEEQDQLRLGDDRRRELRHLFAGEDPHTLLGAPQQEPGPLMAVRARERRRWWKMLEEAEASAPERRWVAGQASRAYLRLARRLERTASLAPGPIPIATTRAAP